MSDLAIIYDCEFLVSDGAMQRFWNGPRDPDPQVVQIGACKLSLTQPYDIVDTFIAYITPIDRSGAPVSLDDLFIGLTGITQSTLDANAQTYANALAAFDEFADEARLWSWGKDELNLIGTGCLTHGIAPPIPAARFRNACDLLLRAGIAYETVTRLRSNTMLEHFGIDYDAGPSHDALADATQVAASLQHLLRSDLLAASDFAA